MNTQWMHRASQGFFYQFFYSMLYHHSKDLTNILFCWLYFLFISSIFFFCYWILFPFDASCNGFNYLIPFLFLIEILFYLNCFTIEIPFIQFSFILIYYKNFFYVLIFLYFNLFIVGILFLMFLSFYCQNILF